MTNAPRHSDLLLHLAEQSATRSYSPYSGRRTGVVILLEDGAVIHGCRVENASFQLTIDALDNAWSTAHAIGRVDVVAVACSRPWSLADRAFLSAMPHLEWAFPQSGLAVLSQELPEPRETLQPLLPDWGDRPEDGAEQARDMAELAWVPESDFPVGAVVRTSSEHHVPGVNVEHPDWHRVLCAERNALSTLVAYGYGPAIEMHVSCVKDPGGTPCGACRQVIVELAPEATVWMDRIDQPPASMNARDLLPGSFTGHTLRKHDG
jgi:homotetrameric cytidine deaminase